MVEDLLWKSSLSGEDRIGSLCVVYKDDCILCEEDEKLLSIVTSAIGVEEKRRLAEEALRKSEEKYRHLVQSANSIILRMSTSGKITFVNVLPESSSAAAKESSLAQTDFPSWFLRWSRQVRAL
jgi:PAS domain-containing protein